MIWGWINTIGSQISCEYFLDYMQVTMRIFGIFKFWNSEQALAWKGNMTIYIYPHLK